MSMNVKDDTLLQIIIVKIIFLHDENAKQKNISRTSNLQQFNLSDLISVYQFSDTALVWCVIDSSCLLACKCFVLFFERIKNKEE